MFFSSLMLNMFDAVCFTIIVKPKELIYVIFLTILCYKCVFKGKKCSYIVTTKELPTCYWSNCENGRQVLEF